MSKVLLLILLGLTAMIQGSDQGKKIKIGINGFGRMGQMVLRAALTRPELDVVAINDPFLSPELMQYQFKYDSARETFSGELSFEDETLIVNDHKITIFSESNPSKIDWSSVGVEFVFECTGISKIIKQAHDQLRGTVKKVVISAPIDGEMFVMGVNENDYQQNTKIISGADYTTNAVAPLIKVLDKKFGISNGLMTTVYAITAKQRSIDGPYRKLRRERGAYQNIIPVTSAAAKNVGQVYKQVEGLLNGMAMIVTVPEGKVIDLVVNLERETTVEEVNDVLREASETYLKGIIGYTEDPLISSDFIDNPYSTIVDPNYTMAVGNKGKTFKIISRYDNEWGYSNRLCDLAIHAAIKDDLL